MHTVHEAGRCGTEESVCIHSPAALRRRHGGVGCHDIPVPPRTSDSRERGRPYTAQSVDAPQSIRGRSFAHLQSWCSPLELIR